VVFYSSVCGALFTTTFESGGECHHHFFLILWGRVVLFLLPEAFSDLKYAENAILAGALPRTQLGELKMLPETP